MNNGKVFPVLREVTTDALKYWEFRRIFYNLLLTIIVVAHFITAWPRSRETVTLEGALGMFLLAVVVNVAYSAVYAADAFIQLSGFRAPLSVAPGADGGRVCVCGNPDALLCELAYLAGAARWIRAGSGSRANRATAGQGIRGAGAAWSACSDEFDQRYRCR